MRRLVDGTLLLDDTYNANPQSMRAALQTLQELSAGRRAVAVLGEMRELGPLAAEEHERLGEAVAASGARLAISCGGLADLAVRAAERAGVEAVLAADADGAARAALEHVAPGDAVLVKASRSVGAERVVAALVAAKGEVIAPRIESVRPGSEAPR